jgi:hypothetical protein
VGFAGQAKHPLAWGTPAIRQLRLPINGTGRRVAGAVDTSGIAMLRVPFRHAAASAPDAQAGPP